nr:unnamed protein product [Digitaria exilis]
MEVEESFQQSKNPRRARRRDLNAMDPTMEESDGEDVGVPEVGMVFNNHTEVNRFYRKYARRVGFGPHSHKKELAYISSLCAAKEGDHVMSQSSGNGPRQPLTAQPRSE